MMEPNVGLRKPKLVVFDVNETLSDLAPLANRFVELGAVAEDARTWFAGLLRDGFALTVVGDNPEFAHLAEGSLRTGFANRKLNRDVEASIAHILEGFSDLGLHRDVGPGLRAMGATGVHMITLSNGAARIAEEILRREGLLDLFEETLSVADAVRWKPAREAYEYALATCGTDAEDALMVAVHPWDLAGAASIGMQTAWINRNGETYPDYFRTPTWAGPSLIALAESLTNLG